MGAVTGLGEPMPALEAPSETMGLAVTDGNREASVTD